MIKIFILILALLPTILFAEEEKHTNALSAGYFTSHDSENFDVKKIILGGTPLYQDAINFQGIQAIDFSYSNADWSKSATQINYINRSIDKKNWIGHDVNVGIKNLGHRELVTADMNYNFMLNEKTIGEVFFSRDYVETKKSLDNNIHYNYFGASIEERFLPNLTLIAMASQHQFSDNNDRTNLKAKLIYNIFPEYGLNVQLRHKRFTDSQEPNGNYFNPDQYFENAFVVGYRKKFNGWMLSGNAGLGRQKVNGDSMTTTKLFDIELMSPIANKFYLDTKAGYSESAGFNGPDYKYQFLQADFIYSF